MGFFIGTVVGELARERGERKLLRAPDGEWRTAGELDDASTRLAHQLLAHGLTPRERVGVWMQDEVECIETYFALAKAGLTGVPIGKLLTGDEASFILEDASVSALVYSSALEAKAAIALKSVPMLRLVVSTDALGSSAELSLEELLARPAPLVTPSFDGNVVGAPMLIGYSSGTTGFPKGVILSERSIEWVTRVSALARRLRPWGVAVMPLSLSFPAAIVAELFTHVCTGSTVVMTPGWNDQILETVASLEATYLMVPTPALLQCTRDIELDASRIATVRTIAHGGSSPAPTTIRRLIDASGTRFTELWGMIENGGGPATCFSESDLERAAAEGVDLSASAGRVVPSSVVEVVNAEGQTGLRGEDAVGELLLRSQSLFTGYLNNPEATSRALVDGWYRTGDVGYIDEAGYVYVLDRRQDVIVSGGINVYPSELERVIGEMPGVKELAVVGVAHERWGRSPVVVIVRDNDLDIGEADVLDYCREHLATYKKPSKVVFVDALPRNASHKIQKDMILAILDVEES